MRFKDNRDFITLLEKTGDVVKIQQPVSWELEIGAIARRSTESSGPAIFAENIEGYPSGYRIFSHCLATLRRLALALGLPPQSSPRQIQNSYEGKIARPIKPVIVREPPCQEKVMSGDEVDLFHFPAPLIHQGDGGRYIGAWHLIATRDPDTGWLNWGMYRAMIVNRNTMAVLLAPYQHQGMMYYGKYLPKNQPMPFALAIGADPLSSLTACTFFRKGESEVDYAGGLHEAPVEVARALTSDLLVPAHAEIVIEGEVLTDCLVLEGPFGEYTGYRHPERRLTPPYRVKAITYRKDPILTISCPGMPFDDGAVCLSITDAVALKKFLQGQGFPVVDAYQPPQAACFLTILSLSRNLPSMAEKIKQVLISRRYEISKLILVDDDIDVFDLSQVIHALATKCHPGRGILSDQVLSSNPLSPYLSHEEREKRKGFIAVFDCTWPSDWTMETDIPPRVSFNEVYPEEIKEKVIRNWKSYGFKE